MPPAAPARARSASVNDSSRSSAVRPASDGVGEPELLTGGENEQAVAPLLVGDHLEVRQQVGHPLDLVESRTVTEALQKPQRVGQGELPLISEEPLNRV